MSGGGTPGGGGGDFGKAKETVVGVLSGGDESPLEDELRAFNTSSMKEGPKSKFICGMKMGRCKSSVSEGGSEMRGVRRERGDRRSIEGGWGNRGGGVEGGRRGKRKKEGEKEKEQERKVQEMEEERKDGKRSKSELKMKLYL